MTGTPDDPAPRLESAGAPQGQHERAVLTALVTHCDRVLGRRELARLAQLTDLSARRCDSVLVGLRRTLGPGSILTVRSRGWRLAGDAVPMAQAVLAQDG